MLVVGLTGGIGSGKSIVAGLFASYGIDVFDADEIAKSLTQPSTSVFETIKQHFGLEILEKDGRLNRQKLREIIFNNSDERLWLENILHPVIRGQLANLIEKATSPYCMIAIPLLVEKLPHPLIHRILVVDTPEEQQLARVTKRDKTTRANTQAIMSTQATRTQRLAHADDIIYNTNALDELIPQVDRLHHFYLSLCQNKG